MQSGGVKKAPTALLGVASKPRCPQPHCDLPLSYLYDRAGKGGPPTRYEDPRLRGTVMRCLDHGSHVVDGRGRVRRLVPE